jgi:threonine synthase
MYTCPHTGVALAALFKLIDRGEIRPSDRVVVISTAHGLKFSPFKTAYHANSLAGVQATRRNPPVTLAADADAVQDAIQRFLDRQEQQIAKGEKNQ